MSKMDYKHAREKEQIQIMEKAQQKGHCPFCWEKLEKYHPNPILKKGSWWWVSENGWPYIGTKLHLIFFYKEHVSNISDIKPEAFKELQLLTTWVEEKFKIKGGALFIRFGDMSYTGSSIQHVHAQLIVGNSKRNTDSEALNVKLGYKKKT